MHPVPVIQMDVQENPLKMMVRLIMDYVVVLVVEEHIIVVTTQTALTPTVIFVPNNHPVVWIWWLAMILKLVVGQNGVTVTHFIVNRLVDRKNVVGIGLIMKDGQKESLVMVAPKARALQIYNRFLDFQPVFLVDNQQPHPLNHHNQQIFHPQAFPQLPFQLPLKLLFQQQFQLGQQIFPPTHH